MVKNYSRLQKVETQKAQKSLRLYLILTIGLIVFFLFFGISFLSQILSLASRFSSSNSPVEIGDQTPPPPPRFDQLPESTNKDRLVITGSSEPGSSVFLKTNEKITEIITNSDGIFSASINLNQGINTLSAYAVDLSSNQSLTSTTAKITFDNKAPEITLTKPQNNETIYVNDKITLEGSIEPKATLTVNDRVVIISSDGKFTYQVVLLSGENIFKFLAIDQASNETKLELLLKFSP